MSVIAKTAYFWRSAAQGIRRAPFVHVVAVLTVAVALFGAGLARAGARWLEGLAGSMSGEVEMTVYLASEVSNAEAVALARALEASLGGTARVVSPDAALERLAVELGDLGPTVRGLTHNPLNASVELRLPLQPRELAQLKALASRARQLPAVVGVDWGEEAAERIVAVVTIVRWLVAAGLVIVLVTASIVVSSTLQLAIYARREEIEIQKLVGATDRFVRAPFLIEGLVQGLMGGLLAVGALWAMRALVGRQLGDALAFLSRAGSGSVLGPQSAAELVVAGMLLGLVGSVIAVHRFLRI